VRSRLALPLLAVGVLLLLTEGLAYLSIALLEWRTDADFTRIAERKHQLVARIGELLEARGEGPIALDSELGWRYRADYRGAPESTNSRGQRGRREYAQAAPDGVVRLAAFGASFVFANEVADDAAWSAVLERLEPRVEVLNYGVGGYGTDQALLLMRRELAAQDADVVLLGFAEIDLARNLNRFRRFLSPRDYPLSKPRFTLAEGGELWLVPDPFPDEASLRALAAQPDLVLRAGPGDAFFEPLEWRNPAYDWLASVRLASTALTRAWRSRLGPEAVYRGGRLNAESEGFRLLVALVRQFATEVRETGRPFLFVIFPTRDRDIWGEGPPAYAPLLAELDDLPVLDLAEALAADPALGPENLWRPGGHYSAEANLAVARAVGQALVDARVLPAAR
jgi:hypothetical protein